MSVGEGMKVILWALIAFIAFLVVLVIIKKSNSIYKNTPSEQNPLEGKRVMFVENECDPQNADGKRGHLEEVSPSIGRRAGFYEKYVKRGLDIVLSFFGLVLLSPLYVLLFLAVVIDDPGPAFFVQKRVGKNKRYFALHKFRSMKMSTPHDVPTHMLENPEQYVTRFGKVLRKLSLDELPQIWDIFIGNMSIVGPRPALWNQDVLTAERDKYCANDVTPGLTGWAQVNGRDELEIPEKAKYDGEYCSNLTFKMDATCFLMTIANVIKGTGVVEGGTGTIAKHIERRQTEIMMKEEGNPIK